jgi:hypothetical protein
MELRILANDGGRLLIFWKAFGLETLTITFPQVFLIFGWVIFNTDLERFVKIYRLFIFPSLSRIFSTDFNLYITQPANRVFPTLHRLLISVSS